jgi:xanthine/uracil/vitamin C permease (AzgA family)
MLTISTDLLFGILIGIGLSVASDMLKKAIRQLSRPRTLILMGLILAVFVLLVYLGVIRLEFLSA